MGIQQATTSRGPASVTLNSDTYLRPTNTASITIDADGNVYATAGGAPSLQYAWLLSGLASSVEVRCTVLSGTFTAGTTGSWLGLGSDRTWERSWPGGMSAVTAVGTFELRDARTQVVLVSVNIALSATP